MKTIIDNNNFIVKLTGRNYDFIATIENKTEDFITITPIEEPEYSFDIALLDWIGLLADGRGYTVLEAIENNKYTIETTTEIPLF